MNRPVWSLWRCGLRRAYIEGRLPIPGDQMLGYREGGQSYPWADVVLFGTGCI